MQLTRVYINQSDSHKGLRNNPPTACFLVGHPGLEKRVPRSYVQPSHLYPNHLIANPRRFLNQMITNASRLHRNNACIFIAERDVETGKQVLLSPLRQHILVDFSRTTTIKTP